MDATFPQILCFLFHFSSIWFLLEGDNSIWWGKNNSDWTNMRCGEGVAKMQSLKCADANVWGASICMNRKNYICLEGRFRDYSSSTVVWGFSQIPLLRDHDIMTKLHKLKLDEMMHSCVSWRYRVGISIHILLLGRENITHFKKRANKKKCKEENYNENEMFDWTRHIERFIYNYFVADSPHIMHTNNMRLRLPWWLY